MDGVLEDDLRIRELVQRVANERPEEIIVATNATVEGEATANLLRSRLQSSGVQGHSPGPRTTDWLRSGVRRRLHAESGTGGPPRLLGGRGLTAAGMGQAVGAQHVAPVPRRSGGLLTRTTRGIACRGAIQRAPTQTPTHVNTYPCEEGAGDESRAYSSSAVSAVGPRCRRSHCSSSCTMSSPLGNASWPLSPSVRPASLSAFCSSSWT